MEFDEIRSVLTQHFRQLLVQRKALIAKNGRLSQLDKSAYETGVAFAQDAASNNWSILPGGNDDAWADGLIEKYGLSVGAESTAYANLRSEMRRAYRDYCVSVLDYDRSLESYSFEDADGVTADKSIQQVAARTLSVSLQELTDRFCAESKRGEQWVSKTQMEKADHVALLTELLGADTDVRTILSTDANRVKETLNRYPRNRRKNPKTRNLSLDEALAVEGVQQLNVQTINKYLQTYGTMFRWARRHGLVSENVFDGLHIRRGKKQAKATRSSFTDSHVRIILRELLLHPAGLVHRDYQKWGPLIALFTGARLNEIAQIHLSDIRQQDDVWCFDLNDEGDKNLKTDASRRRVPIHSRLFDCGLMQYVQALKDEGQTKLFPTFEYCSKNGWGRNLGRWCNDQFLIRLQIKAKGLSFHSFRHTVITNLYQADVPEPIVQEIVGHERQGVTQQHYFSSGYKLTQLRDALEKLPYGAADWWSGLSPGAPEKAAGDRLVAGA